MGPDLEKHRQAIPRAGLSTCESPYAYAQMHTCAYSCKGTHIILHIDTLT